MNLYSGDCVLCVPAPLLAWPGPRVSWLVGAGPRSGLGTPSSVLGSCSSLGLACGAAAGERSVFFYPLVWDPPWVPGWDPVILQVGFGTKPFGSPFTGVQLQLSLWGWKCLVVPGREGDPAGH